MNFELHTLALKFAAAGQFIIAVLGLCLSHLLHWKDDIARMPLLIREVFLIHGWFISLTLGIFSVLTWRFAPDIAHGAHEFLRWFAAGVALFWGVRCVMQWTHYSREHWRGIPSRTAVHWTVFLSYAAFTLTYLRAALM